MPENYKQYDSRWANRAYAGQNMAAAGCGPTATADIICKLPTEIADWMTAHGYASNGYGTYWYGPTASLEAYGFTARQLNSSSLYGVRGGSAENEWLSNMKTGKYYGILLMGPGVFTAGGHFICITQTDKNNRCYVHDPASAARDGWHNWSDFQGCVKVFYLAEKKDSGGSKPVSGGSYTVKSGDTLSKIAADWGVTVAELAEYNGIPNPNIINVGQIIKIPSKNQNSNEGAAYMFEVRKIQVGSQGNDVLLAQEILKSRGFYKGNLDKSFGEQTKAAVIAYQEDRKGGAGPVDGIVGEKCWQDMIAL